MIILGHGDIQTQKMHHTDTMPTRQIKLKKSSNRTTLSRQHILHAWCTEHKCTKSDFIDFLHPTLYALLLTTFYLYETCLMENTTHSHVPYCGSHSGDQRSFSPEGADQAANSTFLGGCMYKALAQVCSGEGFANPMVTLVAEHAVGAVRMVVSVWELCVMGGGYWRLLLLVEW